MEQFYRHSIKEIEHEMNVALDSGLSSSEVEKRLIEFGENRLTSKKKKTLLALFFEQYKSSMVLILLIAVAVSGVIGVIHGEGLLDTYIILGILLVNAIIGLVQERNAESSLEALSKMSSPTPKCLEMERYPYLRSHDVGDSSLPSIHESLRIG